MILFVARMLEIHILYSEMRLTKENDVTQDFLVDQALGDQE